MSAGNGKAAYTYKYNANGDMTEAKSSSCTKTFTYNGENRMTGMTVTGTGAGSWTYSYDADGERTVKKNNTTGTCTVYWFDNYEETYKTSGTSVALTESVKYYKANDGTVAQRVTNKTSGSSSVKYLFKDVLGSTVKVCDENGNVTEFMGYVPYGEQVLLSGSKDAKKTYTGQEPETDDGLYYYHARYYDSSIGRFIQADSVLDGLNRYCYCGNNPVNYTDPSGKYVMPITSTYNMQDLRWKNRPLRGDTTLRYDQKGNFTGFGYTMGEAGCACTCGANFLNTLGSAMTPQDVNKLFCKGGDLNWVAMGRSIGWEATAYSGNFSKQIYNKLKSDKTSIYSVFAYIKLDGGYYHWIGINGFVTITEMDSAGNVTETVYAKVSGSSENDSPGGIRPDWREGENREKLCPVSNIIKYVVMSKKIQQKKKQTYADYSTGKRELYER